MRKKTVIILSCLALFILGLLLLSFKIEQDPLHKRIFTISLSETKNGVVAKKPIQDKLLFKNGRLRSDFLYRKFGYKFLKYRINKDSIYTDSTDTEVRWLEVEAVTTDEKNQTIFVNFITCEWDIDGTIKITKNDKIKRYYDFAGREKGGKPKKIKKKRDKLIEIKEETG
jgi:hypothetical protein